MSRSPSHLELGPNKTRTNSWIATTTTTVPNRVSDRVLDIRATKSSRGRHRGMRGSRASASSTAAMNAALFRNRRCKRRAMTAERQGTTRMATACYLQNSGMGDSPGNVGACVLVLACVLERWWSNGATAGEREPPAWAKRKTRAVQAQVGKAIARRFSDLGRQRAGQGRGRRQWPTARAQLAGPAQAWRRGWREGPGERLAAPGGYCTV